MPFSNVKRDFRSTVLVVALFFATGAYSADLNSHNPEIYFNPHGGCTQAIISQIRMAKSQILVQAYSFTSAPIASALKDAHHRGVHVEVIFDKSQKKKKYTSATFLDNAGIPVYIDAVHAIAHNKIMILDKSTVITGSFNFTKAAEEKNAENLLIIKSPDIAKRYIDNWQAHRQHSEVY